MTWPANLPQQVKQAFRDAHRMNGAHEPRDEEPREALGPRVELVETIGRRRRIVGRRTECIP